MLVELYKTLKIVRKLNDDLILKYNSKSVECYRNGDNIGRDYWNDRAYSIICQNEELDKDIRKLKEEAGQYVNENGEVL